MAQHMLSAPDTNFTDARRNNENGTKTDASNRARGKVLYTANGAGTTTTLVGTAPASGVNAVRVGDEGHIYDTNVYATGVFKGTVVVTAVNAAGTTVTFTPAIAANTAAGYVLRSNALETLNDNRSLDQRLTTAGFSASYIDTMTQNDKVYQVRLLDDPASIKP